MNKIYRADLGSFILKDQSHRYIIAKTLREATELFVAHYGHEPITIELVEVTPLIYRDNILETK